MTFSAYINRVSDKRGNTLVHEDVFRNPNMSLTRKIQMMHMQSCNQIAHSGDKWEERGKEEDEKKKKNKKNRDTKTFG